MRNERRQSNRHSAWERIPLILKYINDYDYVMWIDADAFFYNDANNILDIIDDNINYNFIFSNDIGNNNINTGVYIVKNSQYSIDFLTKKNGTVFLKVILYFVLDVHTIGSVALRLPNIHSLIFKKNNEARSSNPCNNNNPRLFFYHRHHIRMSYRFCFQNDTCRRDYPP